MSDNGDKDSKDLDTSELEDLLDAIESWDPEAEESESLGDHLSGGGTSAPQAAPLYAPPTDLSPKAPEEDATRMVDMAADPRYEDLLKTADESEEEAGELEAVEASAPAELDPFVEVDASVEVDPFGVEVDESVEVDPFDVEVDESVEVDPFDVEVDESVEVDPFGVEVDESVEVDPLEVIESPVQSEPALDSLELIHRGEPIVPGLVVAVADDGSEAGPGDGGDESPGLGAELDLEEMLGDLLPEEGWVAEPEEATPPAGTAIAASAEGAPSEAPPTPLPMPDFGGLADVGAPGAPDFDGDDEELEEDTIEVDAAPPAIAVAASTPPPVAVTPVPTPAPGLTPVPSPVPTVIEAGAAVEALAVVGDDVVAGDAEPDDLSTLIDRFVPREPSTLTVGSVSLSPSDELLARLSTFHESDVEPAPAASAEDLAMRAEEAAEASQDAAQSVNLLACAAMLREMRLGEVERARELYVAAASLGVPSPVVTSGLRRVSMSLGRWDGLDALIDGELALELSSEERLELLLHKAELCLLRLDDLSGATEAYEAAAALAPEDLRPMLGRAQIAYIDGDHEVLGLQAERAAGIVAGKGLRAALELRAGRARELMADPAAALERFSASAELQPGSPSAFAGLARSAEAAGERKTAAQALVQLSELFASGPSVSSFRRRAATMLLAAGEPARAAEIFTDAATTSGWHTVATTSAAAGATAAASRALHALARSVETPALRASHLADVVLLGEDVDAESVRTLLDQLSSDPQAGLLASVIREELSRGAGDAASVATAESEGASRGGALRAAVMLAARSRPGDARRWLMEATNEPETKSEAELALATYLAAAQDWEALTHVYHGLADRADTPAWRTRAMLQLGHVHELRLGDRVAARAAYAHAQEGDDTLLPVIRGLRRTAPDPAARYQASRREAEVSSERLAAVPLYLAAGESAEEAGDRAPALDAYMAALACEPAAHTALVAVERLLRSTGDDAELVSALGQAVGASTEGVAAYGRLRLARIFAERGDHGAAEEALQLVLDGRPKDVAVADAIAHLPVAQGDEAAAAERLETVATHLPPKRRAAALTVAAELWDAIDPERALACLEKARAVDPERPDVTLALQGVMGRLGREDALEELLLPKADAGAPDSVVVGARQRLAELARSRGDDDAEVRHRKAIVELSPDDLPSLHFLAGHELAAGRWEDLAGTLLKLAEAVDDERLSAALALMVIRLRTAESDDPLGPLDVAKLAVDKAPDDLRALVHLYSVASVRGDAGQMARSAAGLSGILGLPRGRAAYDLRAADAYERMGRFEDAADHLLRAGKDGGHPVGFWRASRIAEKLGNSALAAETAESAAEASNVPRQRSAEFLRAARFWYEEVEDTRRAMLALQKCLAADATNPQAAELAKKVTDEHADPQLALDLLAERLAAVENDEEIVALATRAATLAIEVGDRDKAKEHLRAVLQAEPEHRESLSRLAELSSGDGEWREAAQCFIRLARLSEESNEAKGHFFQLGVIYQEKQPDQRRAIQSFRKVLSLDSEHLGALRRLAILLPLAEEWVAAAEVTLKLATVEKDENKRREAWLTLARIYEEGLDDSRQAEAALEKARHSGPTDLVVVRSLAEFYKRQGAGQALVVHLDRAVADFRRLLEENPCDISAYKSLFSVFTLRGSDDAARCAASVLATFGEAGLDEEELIARLGGTAWAPGPMVADIGLDEHLCPPAITPSLRSLFAYIGDSAIRLRPQDPRRLGLGRGDRLGRGHRVLTIAQSMAPWYGLRDVEVWVHPSRADAWHVMAGSPPAIVLGAGLADEADEGTIRFLLARGLSLLQRKLVLLTQLDGEEVSLLLPAVVKLVYPGYETESYDEGKLSDMSRELGRVLNKRVRQEAGPFALECVGDLRVIPDELGERVLDLGDRAALLASGHLDSALHALRLVGSVDRRSMTGPELLACVEDEPRSTALLQFFVSKAHIAVRARLGIAGPM